MGRRPTERLLNGHRQVLDRLVQLLLTKETIDGSEVYALAGRPEPQRANRVTLAPDRGASSAETSCCAWHCGDTERCWPRSTTWVISS